MWLTYFGLLGCTRYTPRRSSVLRAVRGCTFSWTPRNARRSIRLYSCVFVCQMEYSRLPKCCRNDVKIFVDKPNDLLSSVVLQTENVCRNVCLPKKWLYIHTLLINYFNSFAFGQKCHYNMNITKVYTIHKLSTIHFTPKCSAKYLNYYSIKSIGTIRNFLRQLNSVAALPSL